MGRLRRLRLRGPVVHRQGDEDGAAWGEPGEVDSVGEGEGDVLGARRLEGPLDERVRHPGRVAVGEVRLHRHLGPHLLTGGDQQRRFIRLGIEDRPHPVPDPRRGVQVDVGGVPGCLRVAVGHADGYRLLEAEDVAEVLGEVGEHRQLGRPRVAEDRRHAVLAEQLEGGVAHRGHVAHPTAARKIALRAQVAPAIARSVAGGERGKPRI